MSRHNSPSPTTLSSPLEKAGVDSWVQAPRDIIWDVTLLPRRSLSRKKIRRVVVVLAAICFVAALRFAAIGAWPVAVFVLLDIAAIWFAMHMSLKSGGLRERLILSHSALQVVRSRPGAGRRALEESWSFEPTWLRLSAIQTQRGMNALELATHGQKVRIGEFLTDRERKKLENDLLDQLAKWRAGNHLKR